MYEKKLILNILIPYCFCINITRKGMSDIYHDSYTSLGYYMYTCIYTYTSTLQGTSYKDTDSSYEMLHNHILDFLHVNL